MKKLLTILAITATLTTPIAFAQGYGDRFNLTIEQLNRLPGCGQLCSLWKDAEEAGSPSADRYYDLLQDDCNDLLPVILTNDFWCPSRGR